MRDGWSRCSYFAATRSLTVFLFLCKFGCRNVSANADAPSVCKSQTDTHWFQLSVSAWIPRVQYEYTRPRPSATPTCRSSPRLYDLNMIETRQILPNQTNCRKLPLEGRITTCILGVGACALMNGERTSIWKFVDYEKSFRITCRSIPLLPPL
jgi:hypothetical protein